MRASEAGDRRGLASPISTMGMSCKVAEAPRSHSGGSAVAKAAITTGTGTGSGVCRGQRGRISSTHRSTIGTSKSSWWAALAASALVAPALAISTLAAPALAASSLAATSLATASISASTLDDERLV